MIIALQTRLESGAFADVFAIGDAKVGKLFRRKPKDPDGRAVHAIYLAEIAAYERAHADSFLSTHVAAYFGPLVVTSVQDEDGRDVSGGYWIDCCYAIEKLEGEERKIFGVPEPDMPFVYELLHKLSLAGVEHAADASAFGWQRRESLKLVDFATYDAAADYHMLLAGPDGAIVE